MGQADAVADGQTGLWLQAFEQATPQGGVSERGFNKELGLAGFVRQLLQVLQAFFPVDGVLRQITHEGEILAIQAAGRQGQ